MADDAIDSLGNQRVARLDRDEPAEAIAQNKDRHYPQHAAGGKDHNAEPPHGIAIDRPESDPVGVGGNVASQQSDNPEGNQDPAIASVFFDACAEISTGETRHD